MADKINLLQFLLQRARHLHDLGLDQTASCVLWKLSRHPDISAEAAEEIHGRLAQIRFDQGKYRRARRHLASALAHQPANPHYHHLMARATAADPQGNSDRALALFLRAVRLAPECPVYQCDYGLQALSLGQRQAGLRALRKASQLAPDDPGILDKVSQCLMEEGEWDEARRMLQSAMFRNPHSLAFRSLWQQRQFEILQAQQQSARKESAYQGPVPEPVLLPFRRLGPVLRAGKKTIRRDSAAATLKPKRSPVVSPKKARSN